LPIAITYGIAPDFTLPNFFDFKIETADLKNIFRAIMGLYMSMIALWVIGIFKSQYWLIATVTNVFFMSGLGFGRLISLVLDGTPSLKFFIGMLLEFLLAAWGIQNLKRYKHLKSKVY
jgi:thiol:disulfide interchange protein